MKTFSYDLQSSLWPAYIEIILLLIDKLPDQRARPLCFHFWFYIIPAVLFISINDRLNHLVRNKLSQPKFKLHLLEFAYAHIEISVPQVGGAYNLPVWTIRGLPEVLQM